MISSGYNNRRKGEILLYFSILLAVSLLLVIPAHSKVCTENEPCTIQTSECEANDGELYGCTECCHGKYCDQDDFNAGLCDYMGYVYDASVASDTWIDYGTGTHIGDYRVLLTCNHQCCESENICTNRASSGTFGVDWEIDFTDECCTGGSKPCVSGDIYAGTARNTQTCECCDPPDTECNPVYGWSDKDSDGIMDYGECENQNKERECSECSKTSVSEACQSAGKTACCNGICFDPSEYRCCGGNQYDCEDTLCLKNEQCIDANENSEDDSCCNGEGCDSNGNYYKESCCSGDKPACGDKYEFRSGQCIKTQGIKATEKTCYECTENSDCNAEERCCMGKCYNPLTHQCCSGSTWCKPLICEGSGCCNCYDFAETTAVKSIIINGKMSDHIPELVRLKDDVIEAARWEEFKECTYPSDYDCPKKTPSGTKCKTDLISPPKVLITAEPIGGNSGDDNACEGSTSGQFKVNSGNCYKEETAVRKAMEAVTEKLEQLSGSFDCDEGCKKKVSFTIINVKLNTYVVYNTVDVTVKYEIGCVGDGNKWKLTADLYSKKECVKK